MREKLTEILTNNATCLSLGIESCDTCPHRYVEDCYTAALVDHLINNGVTIPVRCGECIHRVKGTWAKCTGRHPDEFCSDGERRFHS